MILWKNINKYYTNFMKFAWKYGNCTCKNATKLQKLWKYFVLNRKQLIT